MTTSWYVRHAEHWEYMAGEGAWVWLALHDLTDSAGPGRVLQAVAADYARWAKQEEEEAPDA